MSNNFRPDKMGIKPYNQISQNRELNNLKMQANPMNGPLAMPPNPVAPAIPNATFNGFEKLRALLGGKRG